MRLSLLSAVLLCGTSAFAFAQDTSNLEKLSSFQTTGTPEFTFIEQTGANADAIRQSGIRTDKMDTLIKLPFLSSLKPCSGFAAGSQAVTALPRSAP